MKKFFLSAALAFAIFSSCSSQDFKKIGNAATNAATNVIQSTTSTNSTTSTQKSALTNDQVINGLKEALTIGANNSASLASKVNGFYKNPALFIPFPPEAKMVKDYANRVGLSSQVAKFEMTLNRAAEEAAKDAAPIFIAAVKSMSIGDGFAILKGADNAATQYLKDKTSAELIAKFTPVVQNAINTVQLTKYWKPIITKYNKIPLVQKQNPDLTAYVTNRALIGLFKLLADEELKIRKDPAAQVTNLLQQVFGSLSH